MTEFLNYTVDLYLKDGTKSSGLITSVDSSKITLNESNGPKEIASGLINDLKVTKLPPDLLKNLKKKEKKKPAKKEKKEKEEPKEAVSNDFDFAANLAMFDKKSIFEDFQKKDKVKPKDRLVGHNKVENVRKEEKYRNDEMVLDGSKTDNWDLIGNNERIEAVRNMSVTGRSTPVESSSKNYSFVNSNKIPIPVCSPIQLSDIERIASENFNHHQDLMTETFASNLSSYVTTKILGGNSRLNSNNHNLPPLVILLIGSERCSARAFSLGRHLANHGIRVLAYVINQNLQDEHYLKQLDMFKKSGGKVLYTSVKEFVNILDNQLDTPVELIIESLQGYDDHLEDIFYDEQERSLLTELITWCDSRSSRIMSLDIPSGIDGGSGTLTENLKISCKWLVSMGIPIAGIIHGYNANVLKNDDDEIIHLLVDIGIPNNVYQKKSNLRRFDKIWYTAENVVEMSLLDKPESQ